MDDSNQIPTPVIVSGETHVQQKELLQKHSEFMARVKEQNKNYKGLNPDSEKITYRNDVGYIFRYEILHASAEEVSKNPSLRSFLVLWTKDFNTADVVTYSGYDFPNPL